MKSVYKPRLRNNKPKLRKILTDLTNKEYEECFKAFKRWLKDNGYYTFIIHYIFQPGVTKESIYSELLEKRATYRWYTFADVLILLPFVDVAYKKYGPEHWNANISPIHNKWHRYVMREAI
jgi:hypothetical protein